MANETVSKTKAATAEVDEQVEQVEKKRKTLTNWKVFQDAGLIPVRVKCEGYAGHHPADMSCHSCLIPDVQHVLAHMQPEHSGGWFRIKFRMSDGKVSPLWKDLEEAGVEIQDFACPHCRAQVQMTPRAIIRHLQNHAGANRVNLDPQTLCLTLGFNRPDDEYGSEMYDSGGF